jgi:hypothetical protein
LVISRNTTERKSSACGASIQIACSRYRMRMHMLLHWHRFETTIEGNEHGEGSSEGEEGSGEVGTGKASSGQSGTGEETCCEEAGRQEVGRLRLSSRAKARERSASRGGTPARN